MSPPSCCSTLPMTFGTASCPTTSGAPGGTYGTVSICSSGARGRARPLYRTPLLRTFPLHPPPPHKRYCFIVPPACVCVRVCVCVRRSDVGGAQVRGCVPRGCVWVRHPGLRCPHVQHHPFLLFHIRCPCGLHHRFRHVLVSRVGGSHGVIVHSPRGQPCSSCHRALRWCFPRVCARRHCSGR